VAGSGRVGLREFTLGDLEAAQQYAGDPEVTRYLAWGPSQIAETYAFLEMSVAGIYALPRSLYDLGIVSSETGQLIGALKLHLGPPQQKGAELGYVVRRDFWGQGIATEAARLGLELGFQGLGLHRISAFCSTQNGASGRVLEKVGMRQEGLLRSHLMVHGQWHDSLAFAILEDEWKS
jgi:RimJ/RimL family protein N-acetyltransferase